MHFSLDNAIVKMGGVLLRQENGIPMGDPISPGMTIGTCARMEQRWLATLSAQWKANFVAARYMDDIIMVYAQNGGWDHTQLLEQFIRSDCYVDPLTLVDAKEDTFLETTFKLEDNRFRRWLKNDNSVDHPHATWRYQHFASCTPFAQKRAVIVSCLRKVQAMASHGELLRASAVQKLLRGVPPLGVPDQCAPESLFSDGDDYSTNG